jgi:hypothetical protein
MKTTAGRGVLLLAQARDQSQARLTRHMNVEQQHVKRVVVEHG